ncbi:MAG: hypothetical protein KDK23_02885 [Leptospiraceae bacterium]|nr:hypothetical protein [Leptospiraceae bacterium]
MPARKSRTKAKGKTPLVHSRDTNKSLDDPEAPEIVLPSMNPLGPYSDPVPKRWNSRSEEFRVWMHSARGWIYSLMLVAMLGPLFYSLGSLNAPGFSDILETYFTANPPGAANTQRFAASGEVDGPEDTGPVYSVGNLHRSGQDIQRTARALRAFQSFPTSRALHSLVPESAGPAPKPGTRQYRAFVQNQYETDLLVHAAFTKGLLEKDSFSTYVHDGFRRLVARAYVFYSLPDSGTTQSVDDPTQAEIKIFRERLGQQASKEALKGLEDQHIRNLYRVWKKRKLEERFRQKRRLLIYREKQRLQSQDRSSLFE